jgi:glycosyltransferase involved in cell wall biosynthesis
MSFHDLLQRARSDFLLGQNVPFQPESPVQATSNAASNRILVIDDRIPYPHLGSGYPRANSVLRTIHSAGWLVTFYPLFHPAVDWDQAYALLPREMEIIADLGVDGLQDFLIKRIGYYNAALVSRPHNMQYFSNAVRNVPEFLGTTKLIYDAEAIFSLRDALRQAVRGAPVSIDERKRCLASEIALARGAAVILAVSEREARHFRAGSSSPVHVVGHSVMPVPSPAAFSGRSDILFVGALDEDDSPNSDSVLWFVHEVMSKLDLLLGSSYKVRIVGRNNSPKIQALASSRVEVLGVIDHLEPLYNSARLCIAPTRFAAGLPMKVHSAAAAGVPVVSTRLIAELLDWRHNVELITADEPETFAVGCYQLFTDSILWHRIRRAALGRIGTDCSPTEFNSRLEAVLAKVARQSVEPIHNYAQNQANAKIISTRAMSWAGPA